MGNVLRILKRDALRLLKAPAALVVVFALLLLPSAYAWYNVIGFWNPYNNTGAMRVCVVNQDEGGDSSLTGPLDVGTMVIEKLHENTQLDWQFTDFDTAMEELNSGTSYAAFVIPSDFTTKLLALTEGKYEKPDIKYYVNEKIGPVAPKVTDTGASTLDETINSTFIATVSDTIVETMTQVATESKDSLNGAKSEASLKIENAIQLLQDTENSISGITDACTQMQQDSGDAKSSLETANKRLSTIKDELSQIQTDLTNAQDALSRFSSIAAPATSNALASATQAAAGASSLANDIAHSLGSASDNLNTTIATLEEITKSGDTLADELTTTAQSLPDESPLKSALNAAADTVRSRTSQARNALETLSSLNADLSNTTTSAKDLATTIGNNTDTALERAAAAQSNLFGSDLPRLSNTLGTMNALLGSLSGSLTGLSALIEQSSALLDQTSETLSAALTAADETLSLLENARSELLTIKTDVDALGQADALTALFGDEALDAQRIADFMGSPTHIVTEQLYQLNSYGAAMAPLFMNLTFWIGAFMLIVIMRTEADDEDIPNLTITQRYLGRFLLFALMAALQAIICCAGILIIGVEAVSPLALFAAAVAASLSYLSIIYALSLTLQHIGKGLCIVLVFAQIPGATGLYPIEMTSSFFQALYPALPFTYGIGAMREAICGFYDGQFATDLLVLALFFCAFMALGILVRPLMANVNRMVATQVRVSGIFNGEQVEVPARPYRLSQIIRALSDRQEYREAVQRRYERFTEVYPRLIRGAAIAGVLVPIALMIIFALTPAEKAILLTIWIAWIVIVFVFLIIVESLRYSIERQMRLEDMSDEKLRSLYSSRTRMLGFPKTTSKDRFNG